MLRYLTLLAVLVVWWAPEASAQPSTSPAPSNPTGAITLRDVVQLTLTQSPELHAFDAARRVAEARQLQAGRRPNPVLSTQVEDIGASVRTSNLADVVQPQTTVQLSQLVELGGKRAAQQRLAGVDRDLVGWDYEAARLDVLTRVTADFLNVLASQEAVAQGTAALELAQQVQQTVAARVQAGVVSPIEETRADVLLANATLEADRTRRALDGARRKLATHWGVTTPQFSTATGELSTLAPLPALDDLLTGVQKSPDIARWVSEVERRRAALSVARASRVPDITVNAGYRRFTGLGVNALVLGMSVPLPLFNRHRDDIRAAEAAIEQATFAAASAHLQVAAQLADAHRALAVAHDEVTTLRGRVLPGARAVFEAVREGYQLGRFGLMDVLDAQRTLADANSRYLTALTTYHQAVTAVERFAARPFAEFTK